MIYFSCFDNSLNVTLLNLNCYQINCIHNNKERSLDLLFLSLEIKLIMVCFFPTMLKEVNNQLWVECQT